MPNVQEKLVPAIGVVVLTKLTSSGGHPEVADAVKPAVSAVAPLAQVSAASKNNSVLKSFIKGMFERLACIRWHPLKKEGVLNRRPALTKSWDLPAESVFLIYLSRQSKFWKIFAFLLSHAR